MVLRGINKLLHVKHLKQSLAINYCCITYYNLNE